MKTLFDLANFFQSRAEKRAEYPTHLELLAQAVKHVLECFTDRDEAADDVGVRFDTYGNEIESSVVHEAIRFWEDNPGICSEPGFDPWPPKPVKKETKRTQTQKKHQNKT